MLMTLTSLIHYYYPAQSVLCGAAKLHTCNLVIIWLQKGIVLGTLQIAIFRHTGIVSL